MLSILLVASLLLPVILIALTLGYDYRVEREVAQAHLRRVSEVAGGIAERAFGEQARIAAEINTLLADMSTQDIAADELHLHQLLQDRVVHVPEIDSIMVISAQGAPLVSATVYPVPSGINLAGRVFFQGALATQTGFYVSAVHAGTIFRVPFFGFGRRWISSAGKTRGVINLIVSPRFFQSVFGGMIDDEAPFGSGELLTLVRSDGAELARYQTPGRTLSIDSAVFAAAAARAPAAGLVTVPAQAVGATGGLRYIAFRKIAGFPLYIVTGMTNAGILAAWRRAVLGHLAVGLPITLVLVGISWIALVRGKREQEALAQARTAIAGRAQAEQTLLRAQRLEAIGQLTGGVAHDFNNLLTVIMGCAEMLERRGNTTQTVQKLAGNIRTAAERGADITANLLAFSRRQPIRPERIDINRNLLDFVPLLRRAANERVTVLMDLAPEVCPVLLDPGQFEAAILNLVGNARDALPDGGSIVIATRNDVNLGGFAEMPTGPILRVSVRDDGAGMDAATAAKAVEPFFTTKGIGRGTGLGLSQVYGFVKQSGGELRIITAPGQGTSVEMILPGSDPLPERVSIKARAAPRLTGTASQVVLVVEDEPSVRAVAVETLRGLGFATLEAADAAQAMLCLQGPERIDLLFSDVVMPGAMNGLALAEAARTLRPEIKVLLTSGYSPAVESAPTRFPLLLKPYHSAQLISLIHAVFTSHATAGVQARTTASDTIADEPFVEPTAAGSSARARPESAGEMPAGGVQAGGGQSARRWAD
jgi:signal transduction histidine kinase